MSLNLAHSVIIETVEETNNDTDSKFVLNDDENNNSLKLPTPVSMLLSESNSEIVCPKIILSPCNERIDEIPISPTSLSFSSSFRIKGILKKPRSYSYSESETISVTYDHNSNHNNSSHVIETRKSFCSSGCNSLLTDDTSDTCGSKKCVSFNNQVIRNIFKPGSTIVGMKKPNSNKNKKKNKRRRTLSDPSHDHDHDKTSDDESSGPNRSSFLSLSFRRSKSISESSDDSSSLVPITSDDTSHDSHCSHDSHDSSVPSDTNSNPDDSQNKKKKRKRKRNKNKSVKITDVQNSTPNQSSKDVFNMEFLVQETKNIINNKND